VPASRPCTFRTSDFDFFTKAMIRVSRSQRHGLRMLRGAGVRLIYGWISVGHGVSGSSWGCGKAKELYGN
jgi:hypothetical protein